MKFASFHLVVLIGVVALSPAVMAGLPDGMIAVVRVTAVDGMANHMADRIDRTTVYSYDGTEYFIDRSALSSMDGVQTLLLIEHRKDRKDGKTMVRSHTQEVRAFNGTDFQISDLEGKMLSYQVAMLGGNLRLLGDGDQILAKAGADGPYQVWRVDRIDLVDRRDVVLR